jgi:hypothetical protein
MIVVTFLEVALCKGIRLKKLNLREEIRELSPSNTETL